MTAKGSTPLVLLFSFERSRSWAYSSAWLERTPDKREVGGSSPPRPTTVMDGGVAQLGERLPCTQEVIGSIPFTSTTSGDRYQETGARKRESPARWYLPESGQVDGLMSWFKRSKD